MARPKLSTVDYFPHSVNHNRYLRIIQAKHNNDGYAIYFKIMELLGESDGHYYNCRDYAAMEDLTTKTLVSVEKTLEILDLMSKLGVIDSELWQEKVIWSPIFIKEIEPVYLKRQRPCPTRPSFPGQKWNHEVVSGPNNTPMHQPQPISVPEIGERKEEKRKKKPTNNAPISGELSDCKNSDDPEPKLLEIKNCLEEIAIAYPDGTFYKRVIQFVNNSIKSRKNYKAIIHCLKSLLRARSSNTNIIIVEKYLEKAMQIEDGRYNADDHHAEAESYKRWSNGEISTLGTILRQIANKS